MHTLHEDLDMGSDDEDDDDKKDEEKKTIKERLQAIQEVSQSVQNTIGFLASLGESVKKYVKHENVMLLQFLIDVNLMLFNYFSVPLIFPSLS